MQLSKEQKLAVEHKNWNMLINAWAGAWKTHTITARIIHLIEEWVVAPYQIMATTFTNKAAREMKDRILGEFKNNPNISFRTPPLIGTFHSIALWFLKKYAERLWYLPNFTIIDANDSTKLLKQIFKEESDKAKKLDVEYFDFIDFLNKSKCAWISPASLKKHLEKKAIESNVILEEEFEDKLFLISLYKKYQYQLKKMNMMDFDDILINFRDVLKMEDVFRSITSEYKYFFVDEFQDTNAIQSEIVKILSEENNNVCVIGDDYQSIYAFRGAKLSNILWFQKKFEDVKIFNLGTNYRSTDNIVKWAASLISNNTKQLHKELNWMKWEWSKIEIVQNTNDYWEAQYIASTIKNRFKNNYKWNLILVRNTALTQPIETVFLREGIPYKIIGWTSFFERVEIKDIKAILEFTVNPYTEISFYRIIDLFIDGVWKKTAEKIVQYCDELILPYNYLFTHTDTLVEKKILTKKVWEKIKDKTDVILWLKDIISGKNIRNDIEAIIIHSNYEKILEDKCANGDEFGDRMSNVKQLLNIANDYFERGENDILSFLDSITIDAEEKTKQELEEDFVSIMTIHRSKWLEFDNVFVYGVNEEILPSKNAKTADEIEEERRLLYVAMTRAKENLFLTYSKYRRIYGQEDFYKPSSFLSEIDFEHFVLIKN